MVNLAQTDHALLKKFWDIEEVFDVEHRRQFHNAFIGAMSNLSDEVVWVSALKTARDLVLKNIKAKEEKKPVADATGDSSDVREENFLRSSRE